MRKRFPWGRSLILLGIVAQLAVPAWMLAKHRLILTRGERVTLSVTVHDPRDLFMGHYVQLGTDSLPPQLEGVPRDYLRYYCDQRYALPFERIVRDTRLTAELDVRVWRGAALAEALRIDGVPAYDYVKANAYAPEPAPPSAPQAPKRWQLTTWAPEPILWELLDEDWELRRRLFPEMLGSTTHLHIVPRAEVLWREVAHALRLSPPPTLRPVTPKECEAHWDTLRAIDRPRGGDFVKTLPIFAGLPEGMPCGKPFAAQAKAYYGVIKGELRHGSLAFIGAVAPERARAAQAAQLEAFPKSDWILPWEDGPLPPGLDLGRVVLLLEAMPATPPPCRWLLAAERLPDPLPDDGRWCGVAVDFSPFSSLPEPIMTAEEALRQLRALEGKRPSETDRYVFALAAEALARYRRTRNPRFLAHLDALLLHSPKHTLRYWFERVCPTYDAYCRLIRTLREYEARGQLVCLGGWAAVRPTQGDPPEPPKAIDPTVSDLLRLGQAILAPLP